MYMFVLSDVIDQRLFPIVPPFYVFGVYVLLFLLRLGWACFLHCNYQ